MIDLTPLITNGTTRHTLAGRLSSYHHSIVAVGGFESLQCGYACSAEEARAALGWLGDQLTIYGPHGTTAWDGQITHVEATLGNERRSRSLEPLANAIKVRFTSFAGTAMTAPTGGVWLIDADSVARYGRKETILSIDGATDMASATLYATRALAEMAQPRVVSAPTFATGEAGGISVAIEAAGWYYTLDWLTLAQPDQTRALSGDQIGALLGSYASTNDAGLAARISDTGVLAPRAADQDMTYRGKLEQLLSYGAANGERLVGGVYEDRELRVKEWAGSTWLQSPAPATLISYAGSNLVLAPGGRVIDPYDVRPDAVCQLIDLDDAAATEGAGRFYVERVSLDISLDSVSLVLEPTEYRGLDTQLATLNAGIRT